MAKAAYTTLDAILRGKRSKFIKTTVRIPHRAPKPGELWAPYRKNHQP
jgi:hypothetical protein